VSQLSSATALAVQAPPSIRREQKRLEITTPCLLNSRGATTKVPMGKTSSSQTVYANTLYSQPDKNSLSSYMLATDNNASPFVSYLDQQYHAMALALNMANHQTPIPTTLSKVLASSAKTEWLAAMNHKFDAILLNGTFPLPPGRKAISTPWVLKIKHDSSYKARWVAHSFSQHEGIYYLDTYAPVLHLKNLLFLLTYTILMGYEIHLMDIDNAFLQALLNEDIYISQAEGFESKEHPDYVCHLICAFYGLKQAPLAWNHTLNQYLLDLGFESTPANPCVYHYHESSKCNKAYENEMHSTFRLNTTDRTVILSIYFDDLILIGHLNNIKLLKKKLHECFRLKDLGCVTRILGFTICYNPDAGTLNLLQPNKITELNDKFGLTEI